METEVGWAFYPDRVAVREIACATVMVKLKILSKGGPAPLDFVGCLGIV
jgi:hypothetical protein